MTHLIHAPWTAEQVTALNAFQHHGRMHPFTCGAEHASGRSPVLIATNGGWVCPDPQCVYRQDWAHAFMVERGAAVSAAVAPPTNRAAAEAALAAVEAALCDTLLPDAREEALARLMKVLPPTTDRAAVLREAADVAESLRQFERATGARWAAQVSENVGILRVADELRRMADETATETPDAAEPTAEDIARAHVTSLHLIGEQLATIESWFWEHLADIRDAGARQDGAQQP